MRKKNNVIYKIESILTEKFYIGSATYFCPRRAQHSHHLKKGTHNNPKLQHHVNKYGYDDLLFSFIEKDLTDEELIPREQHYIDVLNPWFNIHKIAQSPKGLKRTPEQIQNMVNGRLAKSGYPKGRFVSEETRKKLGDAHRGKKLSPEHIQLIKKRNTGVVPSAETREKIRLASTGRLHSDESRKKMSEAAIGNKNWMHIDYKSPIRSEKLRKAFSKPVLQFKDGVFIKEWASKKEASVVLKLSYGNIWQCINGRRKTTGGYSWKLK